MKNGKLTDEFLAKLNLDTEIEAEKKFNKGEKFSWFNFFWKSKWEFLRRFIFQKSFLKGFNGFVLAFLAFYYQVVLEIKLWEREKIH